MPDDPQVIDRHLLAAIGHPVAGRFVQVGIPLRLSVDAPVVKGSAPAPARCEAAAGQGARVKIDAGIGADLASIARRTGAAEAAGLDCIWAAETVNDPFLSLAIAAEHSERVSIGTAVAIAFARNPMSLAYTANQLQEFSQGRMILGLGSQVRSHIERRFSAEWSHPAARMREFVLAMRAVWASWNDGARLDFNGDFYTHTLMTPVFAPEAESVRRAARVPRRGRAVDDRSGGRGCRRCDHARRVQPAVPPRGHLARARARARQVGPHARRRGGDVPGLHRGRRHRGAAAESAGGDAASLVLLRVDARVPAGAGVAGVG